MVKETAPTYFLTPPLFISYFPAPTNLRYTVLFPWVKHLGCSELKVMEPTAYARGQHLRLLQLSRPPILTGRLPPFPSQPSPPSCLRKEIGQMACVPSETQTLNGSSGPSRVPNSPNDFFFFFVFCLFRTAPKAHGGSQARSRIRATAAHLHHSHSNSGS